MKIIRESKHYRILLDEIGYHVRFIKDNHLSAWGSLDHCLEFVADSEKFIEEFYK